MTLEQFAKENGFFELTNQNHPQNGQTVEILGASISKKINTEKVRWFFDGKTHRYNWITEDFNKGIMTTSMDYWKPL